MLFLNSTRSRLYVDTKWGGVNSAWKIRNKIKFESNNQHEGEVFDGRMQEGRRLNRWTMVNALDYQWQLGARISLFSGIKMRYRREWNSVDAEDTANERHTIPIAKLQYRLTERTRFHLCIQGVGFFLPHGSKTRRTQTGRLSSLMPWRWFQIIQAFWLHCFYERWS